MRKSCCAVDPDSENSSKLTAEIVCATCSDLALERVCALPGALRALWARQMGFCGIVWKATRYTFRVLLRLRKGKTSITLLYRMCHSFGIFQTDAFLTPHRRRNSGRVRSVANCIQRSSQRTRQRTVLENNRNLATPQDRMPYCPPLQQ